MWREAGIKNKCSSKKSIFIYFYIRSNPLENMYHETRTRVLCVFNYSFVWSISISANIPDHRHHHHFNRFIISPICVILEFKAQVKTESFQFSMELSYSKYIFFSKAKEDHNCMVCSFSFESSRRKCITIKTDDFQCDTKTKIMIITLHFNNF